METCTSCLPRLFFPGGRIHRKLRREFRPSLCSSLPSFGKNLNSFPTYADVPSVNVTEERPWRRSWTQFICDSLEDAADMHINRSPLQKTEDPSHLLVGNFAPVEELPPTPCSVVKGTIPKCLSGGAYLRNGPNPRQRRRGPAHLFDGEGMLHSLLLPVHDSQHSHPVLCSRYCRTSPPVLSKIFSLRGLHGMARVFIMLIRVLTGQMDQTEGMGPANTSVNFFWDRIFVLGETDPPFPVYLSPENGELLPVERRDFRRNQEKRGTSAHYKHDKAQGEHFALSYGIVPPFLRLICFDSCGNKKRELPIWSVRQPSIFHDFAVTKRYAVFPETQLVMDPFGMAFFNGPFISFDAKKISRVGVQSRYGSRPDVKWFDIPGFNPIHVCNAWEEEDEEGGVMVVLVGSCAVNMEHFVQRTNLVHSLMETVRIDLKNSIVIRTPLSAMSLGFDVVNPGYQGRKSRYAYAAIDGEPPKIRGVAKLDLDLAEKRVDCVVARREFEPGCYGGEPFFVPKGEEDGLQEDDGYLLMFIHDENEGKSKFIAMDAKSPELEVVVEVELPQRVPYGFHGVFVSQSELKRQRR